MSERLTFACRECGWESRPPAGVEMVFHPCQATRSRRRLNRLDHQLASIEERREAERVEWARQKLGPLAAAFEAEVGPEALLRPVDDIELARRVEEEE